jgi:hypothetical protein
MLKFHDSHALNHGDIIPNHEIIIRLAIIGINLKNPASILWNPQECLKDSMGSLSMTASVALESLVPTPGSQLSHSRNA